VPGNPAPDGQTATYAAVVKAEDQRGNQAASSPLTLTVQPAASPVAGAPEFQARAPSWVGT